MVAPAGALAALCQLSATVPQSLHLARNGMVSLPASGMVALFSRKQRGNRRHIHFTGCVPGIIGSLHPDPD